jgi:hypothetical protein
MSSLLIKGTAMNILARGYHAVFESHLQQLGANPVSPTLKLPTGQQTAASTNSQFRMPLHERMGLAVLDSVVMAVSIGGLVFTLFVAYSILK